MNEPYWYELLPRWARKVVDQIGHMLIGGVPAALVGGISLIELSAQWAGAAGALAGSIAMGLYELVQNWGDDENDYADMAIDLIFGIGSAVAVGAIIWAVA